MRIIGLTGGIACGKSVVSSQLIKEGIPVIDCDLIAKEVVIPGKSAYKKIVARFGKVVCPVANGPLDRYSSSYHVTFLLKFCFHIYLSCKG